MNFFNTILQSKCLIKTSQQLIYRISIKNFNSLPCRNTLDIIDRPNKFPRQTIRSLHTTSTKFNNVTDNTLAKKNVDTEKKNENTVIYYGTLTGQVKGIKVFTCISSIGGIVLQPIIIKNLMEGENLPLSVAIFVSISFFTFVTPLLIHLLTRKYVTEIRYNAATDTYTAVTLSFFLQRVNIEFKVSDVKVPTIPPIFTTMTIKDKPLFIISDCFLEINHYIKMMKYDKPMDLEMGSNTNVSENNK